MSRTGRRKPSTFRQWVDDSHLGYTMVTALERFLGTFSPPFVVMIGLLLMALIGLIDAVTGPFAVAVFYLVPIGLVTYARGRWVGTLMAALAALAWSGVELAQHVTTFDAAVTYWNWLTRFYVYEAVALLIAPMRDVVTWEREVAEREAEAADKLRSRPEARSAPEAVALLIAPMRDVVTWEREVAEREAEAADKLRALNELRAAIEAEEGGQLARLEAMVEFRRAMTQAEIVHISS